jgi:hypothetical protein
MDIKSNFDLFNIILHHEIILIYSKDIQIENFLREGMKRFGLYKTRKSWWVIMALKIRHILIHLLI